jgi:hypothetical protein
MLTILLAAAALAFAPDAPEPLERLSDYEPRSIEGFRVMVHEDLLADEPLWSRVELHLRADLDRVATLLPEPAVARLRASTPIWAEREREHSPVGMSGRGMCYHPSREWLASNGVLPDKAGGIEIQNADDFLNWRNNQPLSLLHEFAHAWMHAGPVDRAAIEGAYASAMEAGLYDAVAYNLASEPRRAYAANNSMEYFAELSEAYFVLNDYFPFTRRQLADHDPAGLAVIEAAWNAAEETGDGDTSEPAP